MLAEFGDEELERQPQADRQKQHHDIMDIEVESGHVCNERQAQAQTQAAEPDDPVPDSGR
jgi:hypothetical protein